MSADYDRDARAELSELTALSHDERIERVSAHLAALPAPRSAGLSEALEAHPRLSERFGPEVAERIVAAIIAPHHKRPGPAPDGEKREAIELVQLLRDLGKDQGSPAPRRRAAKAVSDALGTYTDDDGEQARFLPEERAIKRLKELDKARDDQMRAEAFFRALWAELPADWRPGQADA